VQFENNIIRFNYQMIVRQKIIAIQHIEKEN